MRTFIAVRCPEEIKGQLVRVQKEIGGLGDLRMVSPENIHLTERFLGEVEDSKVQEIIRDLEAVKKKQFSVSLKGVGAFPGPGSPKVVWVGVGEGKKELEELHKEIDRALEKHGLEKDERFACHYTLARVKYVKDKTALAKVIEKYKNKEFGYFEPEGFDLMKSTLTPNGPVYTEIRSFAFSR